MWASFFYDTKFYNTKKNVCVKLLHMCILNTICVNRNSLYFLGNGS